MATSKKVTSKTATTVAPVVALTPGQKAWQTRQANAAAKLQSTQSPVTASKVNPIVNEAPLSAGKKAAATRAANKAKFNTPAVTPEPVKLSPAQKAAATRKANKAKTLKHEEPAASPKVATGKGGEY